MTGDERWAYLVAVPALVAALPFYVASTAYYWWCREGFASFLEFAESCQGLPDRERTDDVDAA